MANAMDDILSPFTESQAQAARLGVPDVTGGKMPLAPGIGGDLAAGDTVNLNAGAPPAYVPKPLVGQAAPEPAAASVAVPSPVVQQQPQQQAAPLVQQRETMTQIAPKLSEEQKANEQKAFESVLASNNAAAELDAQKALEAEQANIIRNRQLERQRIADEAEAAKIKADSEAATQKWASAVDEYKSSLAKRGAKGFQENLGVGGGILAAIAQGLGAFGSALTGGPNHAMNILNKAADDYVRKQEDEIEGKKGAVDVAQNAVAFFRQKGMDAKSASAAARMSILDRAAERIDLLASQYKNPEILQRAQAMKDQLMLQRTQALNSQALNEQNRIVSKTVSGPAAGPSVENQLKMRALEVHIPQTDPKTGKEMGSVTMYAPDAESARKVREAQTEASSMKRNLKVMKSLIADSWQLQVGQTPERVTRLYNKIIEQEGKLAGLGALSEADLRIASVLGNPTSLTQRKSTTMKLIDDTIGSIDGKIAEHYRAQGFIQ